MITLGRCTVVVLSSICVTSAMGQSNVTLFGSLDAGVSYVGNEGGHASTKFDDGIFTPSVFGFRGSEDIGGGTNLIFQLVNQFSFGNGEIVGNGLFSRAAFVGMKNEHIGTLTLGNQYEFMTDTLFFSGIDAARDIGGTTHSAARVTQ